MDLYLNSLKNTSVSQELLLVPQNMMKVRMFSYNYSI